MNPSLVLVQPRKTHPFILERLLMGCKESNQTNKTSQGLGWVAYSLPWLATDASLTADPGVASLIPARSHTFVEIDYEIISTVILFPSAESFKKVCCQFKAQVCALSTGYMLVQALSNKTNKNKQKEHPKDSSSKDIV